MVLISIILSVWLVLALLVVAICRAAAVGDAAQARDLRRLGRFSRSGGVQRPRHRPAAR